MTPGGKGSTAALAALTALLAVPALAAAKPITKSTFSVPVTQPDATGQPVSLDTDVYLPKRRPPRRGWPLVVFFHGGGSDKSNPYDAGHARFFARHGYATLIYSARGHGDSGGQTTVAGPKEMRDTFDVIAWALGIGGRTQPEHATFHVDRSRIALSGYSQGGLNTNLAQVWSSDPKLDPYGIRFRALEPGNTPDYVFQALVQNAVVKLSFGVGLLETYLVGAHAHIEPVVEKWIATAAADQPGLYGGASLCAHGSHDTLSSTMKADLAVRSTGCFIARMRPPSAWAQGFDDFLFPADMAVHMWRRMPNPADRLYLDMGGHAAPSAPAGVERDKLGWQLEFLDHWLRGRRLRGPRVVYWSRRPRVAVPGDSYAYPANAWVRGTSPTWPPRGTERRRFQLGADGSLRRRRAGGGSLPLAPVSEDFANDPVARAALGGSPLGTSPVPSAVPATSLPGAIAGFETAPLRRTLELDGAARVRTAWTPNGADSQLVMQLLDVAPDGSLTLLGRGVRGFRGARAGEVLHVRIAVNQMSARLRRGDRLLVWLSAGDASFYKPYPDSSGGSLAVGPGATLAVPLRRR